MSEIPYLIYIVFFLFLISIVVGIYYIIKAKFLVTSGGRIEKSRRYIILAGIFLFVIPSILLTEIKILLQQTPPTHITCDDNNILTDDLLDEYAQQCIFKPKLTLSNKKIYSIQDCNTPPEFMKDELLPAIFTSKCYTEVALIIKNKTVCHELENQIRDYKMDPASVVDTCFLKLAVTTNNKDICNDISSQESKDVCISIINNDIDGCQRTTLNNRYYCFSNIALHTKNPLICQKLSAKEGISAQPNCIRELAISTLNASVCELNTEWSSLLTPEEFLEECQREVEEEKAYLYVQGILKNRSVSNNIRECKKGNALYPYCKEDQDCFCDKTMEIAAVKSRLCVYTGISSMTQPCFTPLKCVKNRCIAELPPSLARKN